MDGSAVTAVPVIDLSAALAGGAQARLDAARAISVACSEIGFSRCVDTASSGA